MFVRARPYVDVDKLLKCISMKEPSIIEKDNTKLYFNSGSAALRWFLTQYSEKENRRLNVGVQVFTCASVREAITDSQNEVVFLDVNQECFTTLLAQLEPYKNELDILVLTHLFGIANPQYIEIRKWCQENKIELINDLALSVHAKVKDRTIESFNDYYFYSFFFDKPLSSGFGGMLKVKKEDKCLIENYKNLQVMTNKDYMINIKLFYLFYLLTDETIYKKEFRWNSFLEKWIVQILTIEQINEYKNLIFRLLSSKFHYFIAKIWNVLYSSFIKKDKKILKMHPLHKEYTIYVQQRTTKILDMYKNNTHTMFKVLEQKYNINTSRLETSYGQRYALLTKERNKIINALTQDGIESGAHNWPILICQDYDKLKYPNAMKLTHEVLNIPVWSDKIWTS